MRLNGAAVVTVGKPGTAKRDCGHRALPQPRGGDSAVRNARDQLNQPGEKVEASSSSPKTPRDCGSERQIPSQGLVSESVQTNPV